MRNSNLGLDVRQQRETKEREESQDVCLNPLFNIYKAETKNPNQMQITAELKDLHFP